MNARGTTLIEVVAALAILSTAIVGLLLAQSRAVEQAAATQRSARAADLARELLSDWHLAGVDTTVPDSGTIPGQMNWSWRRTAAPVTVAESTRMTRVTLEILTTIEPRPAVVAHYDWLITPHETDGP